MAVFFLPNWFTGRLALHRYLTPPPLLPCPPLPPRCIPCCCCCHPWGRRGGPHHKVAVVLSLGLHVVEATPPHLGMCRRIAVHLEQNDAEEAISVLVDRCDVKGGVVLGPEESGEAG
jgi:hypothetical protein